MKKAPEFLKKYFWDIDFDTFDPEKHPEYTIERLLELGDVDSLRWLFKTFTKAQIIHALKTKRGLSPMAANFWCLVLDVDKKNVACLQKPYLTIRQTHWPY